jgi:dipeptide transport system permease protein
MRPEVPTMSTVIDSTSPSAAAAAPSLLREFWASFSANRGALLAALFFGVLVLGALLAPWVAPHDPAEQFREAFLTPPVWADGGTARFLLGTDELGRDILSRLLHGARLSLMIGLVSVVLALVPGVVLGLLAAFYPRFAGPLIMRAMDIMMALPSLLLAVAVVAVLGPGLGNTMIAIAVVSLPSYVRLARASAMAELPRDYVVASRLAGAGAVRLMFNTVLPNCMAPIIVQTQTPEATVPVLIFIIVGIALILWSVRRSDRDEEAAMPLPAASVAETKKRPA